MVYLDAVFPLQPLVQRQSLGRVRIPRRELPELVAGAGRWHLPGQLPGQLRIRDCAVRHVLSPSGTVASQLGAVAPPPVWTDSVVSSSSLVRTSAPLPRPRTVWRGPGISRSAGTHRASSSPLRAGPARTVGRTSVSPGAARTTRLPPVRTDRFSFPARTYRRRGSSSIRSSRSSSVRRSPSIWRRPAPAWRSCPLRGPSLVEGRAGPPG